MNILSPSLLSANFYNLQRDIEILEEKDIKNLHLDVMDGNFVPSISFGIPVIKEVRKNTKLFFDVHMMVTEPGRYIDDFVKAGADLISVHYEACKHLDRTINYIKDAGIKAGVVLNPASNISLIEDILGELDLVLLMSVNPGFGGQKYIEYTTAKIEKLKKIKEDKKLDFSIQVDGGINASNILKVLTAGADNIVAGSAVFVGDIRKNIDELREAAKFNIK